MRNIFQGLVMFRHIIKTWAKITNPFFTKVLHTEVKEEIIDHLDRRQCVVIKGETGSGKTTQVPLFILEDCMKKGVACNIWVTQPRRMAAITIADHVAASRAWKGEGNKVGKLIGYQVGLDPCYSRDTRILYMTAGIATNKLMMDRAQENLTHLIIGKGYPF